MELWCKLVCHAGLKNQRLGFDSLRFHKIKKMEEEKKLTFEEKLEGWRNRMAFARTIARIIAVTVQIVITYLLLKK